MNQWLKRHNDLTVLPVAEGGIKPQGNREPAFTVLSLPGPRETWDQDGNLARVEWQQVSIYRLNKGSLARCGEWRKSDPFDPPERKTWYPRLEFRKIPGCFTGMRMTDYMRKNGGPFAREFLTMAYALRLYQHKPRLYLFARGISDQSKAGKALLAFWAAIRMINTVRRE